MSKSTTLWQSTAVVKSPHRPDVVAWTVQFCTAEWLTALRLNNTDGSSSKQPARRSGASEAERPACR
jgi:hypothetical protein